MVKTTRLILGYDDNIFILLAYSLMHLFVFTRLDYWKELVVIIIIFLL